MGFFHTGMFRFSPVTIFVAVVTIADGLELQALHNIFYLTRPMLHLIYRNWPTLDGRWRQIRVRPLHNVQLLWKTCSCSTYLKGVELALIVLNLGSK